jgi:DMSO reductase anchor subunit
MFYNKLFHYSFILINNPNIPSMKKIYFLSLVVTVLFFSCQKSNTLAPTTQTLTTSNSATTSPAYFVTCNIDGVAKNFNISAGATKTTTAWNFTILSFKGLTAATSQEALSISIDNSLSADHIVTGTYTDISPRFSIEAVYVSDAALNYNAGSEVAKTISNHLTTTITSIANDEIRGTFSGDFYYNNDPTAAKKSITNGSFFVKIK